jgi:hypothetical protein
MIALITLMIRIVVLVFIIRLTKYLISGVFIIITRTVRPPRIVLSSRKLLFTNRVMCKYVIIIVISKWVLLEGHAVIELLLFFVVIVVMIGGVDIVIVELSLYWVVMWTRLFSEVGLLWMHLVDWNRLLSIKEIWVAVPLRNIIPRRCLINWIVNLIWITGLPLVYLRKSLLALW